MSGKWRCEGCGVHPRDADVLGDHHAVLANEDGDINWCGPVVQVESEGGGDE